MCQAAFLTLWIHREPARPSNPAQSSGAAKPEMSEGAGGRKRPAGSVLFADLKEKGAVVQGEGQLSEAGVESCGQGQVASGWARSQEARSLSRRKDVSSGPTAMRRRAECRKEIRGCYQLEGDREPGEGRERQRGGKG